MHPIYGLEESVREDVARLRASPHVKPATGERLITSAGLNAAGAVPAVPALVLQRPLHSLSRASCLPPQPTLR